MNLLKRISRYLFGILIFSAIFFTILEISLGYISKNRRNSFLHPDLPVLIWKQVSHHENSKDGDLARVSRVLNTWKSKNTIPDNFQLFGPHTHEPGNYGYRGTKNGLPLFEGIYQRLTPNLNDEYVLKTPWGITKYRMKISTDKYGRRKTGYEEMSGKRKINVIFLGCSVTLGDGVNDSDTLPSLFGKKNSNVLSYNFGVTGASPATILNNIEKFQNQYFAGVNPELPTIVVFNYMQGHMGRIVGTSNYLPTVAMAIKHHPLYFLKDELLSKDENFFTDPWKFRKLLLRYGQSNIGKYSGLELPVIYSYHYKLTARIFSEIERNFKVRFKNLKFYVAFHPQRMEPMLKLEEQLREVNIKSIGNKYFNLMTLTKFHAQLPDDAHPSPMYYDIFSDILTSDLKNLGHLQ